ncbi:hypothetical protein PRZ61_12400 [Halomonas pacifica]|uniref:hypothetical protein n=1 Tax=Bisbaumannia pacifica TaxID=77098 RepID=UPI0023597CDE|nr:hypothetical protein [Halomonas pacifica]MDC8804242.1 hypothetical protein [Halomonas pacifica]
MSDVTDIADYRPHISVSTPDGNVHIVPEEFFLGVVEGRYSIDHLADRDQILRSIIGQWLAMLRDGRAS